MINVEDILEKCQFTKNGCLEWIGRKNEWNYFSIWDSYQKKSVRGNRLMWEFMNGPLPDGLWVLHHCDNPPCVNPLHLFAGTQHDNMVDAYKKGRLNMNRPNYHRKGENHPGHKFTKDQIIEMRTLRQSGLTLERLSARYGVGQSLISRIVRGKAWKHLPLVQEILKRG